MLGSVNKVVSISARKANLKRRIRQQPRGGNLSRGTQSLYHLGSALAVRPLYARFLDFAASCSA